MRIGVLGPLYVRGRTDHTPNARKLRTALGMLVAHAGRSVPAGVFTEELWEGDAPASKETTLQTYVLSLRKILARATGLPATEVSQKLLQTKSGGYLLDTSTMEVDARNYQELVKAGSRALSRADDETGIRLLSQARALWRGSAFEGVPPGPTLESRCREYEESLLVVTEYLIDAKLRRGMYREVLSELVSLSAKNPLHEGLHAQHMHALHLSGRRADALEVYRNLRSRLSEELGIEPGPRLQRLQQAVLNAEAELDAYVGAVPPSGPIPCAST